MVIGLGVIPADSGLGATNADRCGVDWVQEGFTSGTIQPWCVVEAEADMDLNGAPVFVRGNSYNHHSYRWPNPNSDGLVTY